MNQRISPRLPGQSTIIYVIGLAAVLLSCALAKEFGLIDGTSAKRVVGILIGVVFIMTGNALPKIVQPLSMQRRPHGSTRSTERFAGWIFVLTGIAYVGLWLLAPLDDVTVASSGLGITAFLLVAAVALASTRRERSRPPRDQVITKQAVQMSQHVFAVRSAILMILHAILWVFAMFLADSIWGDGVGQWMAILFVIANGGLFSYLIAQHRQGAAMEPSVDSSPPRPRP